MKLAEIKRLAETHSTAQLEAAEAALAEGRTPEIEIQGEDEGDKLTHAYAALEIKKAVDEGKELKEAMRDFAGRVRSSLS